MTSATSVHGTSPALRLPLEAARTTATKTKPTSQTPALLPVGHFDPVFSNPVSLGTEFRVPDVGRIDALFVSPAGYLTIVETKLWRNPEARRKVVAQVIDYAQRLAKWSYSGLESAFRDRRQAGGEAPVSLFEHICDAEDNPVEEAEFVNAVSRSLRHGRFLLLVVGDGIREGVEDLTAFLQQTPTLQYTLGLVELACYQRPGGNSDLLFVPQIVARTAEITRAIVRIDIRGGSAEAVDVAAEVPSETPSKRSTRRDRLSEGEFYDALSQTTSADAADRFHELVDALSEEHETLDRGFVQPGETDHDD